VQQLIEYIEKHTDRGECQCGRCFDKGPDREAPPHSVNVHFFWVSARENPTKAELLKRLAAEYPDMDRLRAGPSYIELGALLGDQGLALRLIALGKLVGLWPAITPATIGASGETADQLAGAGFVMAGGFADSTDPSSSSAGLANTSTEQASGSIQPKGAGGSDV
jgi:hypothetical protein